MVDKKHLTDDRSYVLFDPEPLLNSTDQYTKYSPEDLLDIIKNYDSDFEKYEASKKLMLKNSTLQTVSENEPSNKNQICENNDLKNLSNTTDIKMNNINTDQLLESQHKPLINCEDEKLVNKVCSESNISNESIIDDPKIDINNSQRLRFTDIYSLFQIPDFSLLKPVQHDSEFAHLTDADESDVSTMMCEKSSKAEEFSEEENYNEEEYCDEEESCDEEEYYDEEEECCDEEEYCEEEECCDEEECSDEEDSCNEEYCDEDKYHDKQENPNEKEYCDNKKLYEEEIDLVAENKSFDERYTNKNCFYNHNNHGIHFEKDSCKSTQKPFCNNIQKYNFPKTEEKNIEINDHQVVDYEILNDWYSQWKQQMNRIQTFVRMSK